jgi:hypothetical protein
MSCHPCTRAEKNPLAGMYQADCPNCRARAFAHGQAMFEAEQAGKKTKRYKAALKTVFGEDKADQDAGHLASRAWAKKIKQHTKEAK